MSETCRELWRLGDPLACGVSLTLSEREREKGLVGSNLGWHGF